MVNLIKMYNDIEMSGTIRYNTFIKFSKKLSKILQSNSNYKGYDYTDYFELMFNGAKSVLKWKKGVWRGYAADVVVWLTLVDLLILRPCGYYFTNQYLYFCEIYNEPKHIIVSLFTSKDDDITTKIINYTIEYDSPTTTETIIPKNYWLYIAGQLVNENFTDFDIIFDEIEEENVIRYYKKNSDEPYEPKGKEDNIKLKKFINKNMIDNVLNLIS